VIGLGFTHLLALSFLPWCWKNSTNLFCASLAT